MRIEKSTGNLVSIILPVYNESATLHAVIERVLAATLPPGCAKEVIVVDDGSTDDSRAILNSYRSRGVIIGHASILNFGKGTAVRIGFSLASGDIVLIQDGDMEYDPNDYSAILAPILKGDADVVYGSRFLGKPKGMAFKNLLANRILTLSANLLFGAHITDEATAYKAFRTSLIRQMRLNSRRFELCPELTAKVCRLGYHIHEVPITYNARGIAEGKKIRARDGVEALWTLLRHRFTPLNRIAGPVVPVAKSTAQPSWDSHHLSLAVPSRTKSVSSTDPN
jgi:glycosyltransferase involved in cell wall biosynthesis